MVAIDRVRQWRAGGIAGGIAGSPRISGFATGLWRRLIVPVTHKEDERRKEFILTVLLLGAVVLAMAAVAASGYHHFIGARHLSSDSLIVPLVVLGFLFGLYALARTGHYRISAYIYSAILLIAGTSVLYRWSIDTPTGLLIYALLLVTAGLMLGTRFALVISLCVVVALITLGTLQANGILHPDTSWLDDQIEASDIAVFGVIFGIIVLVSWLSNRDIERSLARARVSEAALKHERDNLEHTVVERTSQLEQAQAQRNLELERFAEFGRLSAGLLHDVANPVAAVSLNLQQLDEQERSELVREARSSVRYLEEYIETARKQLQGDSTAQWFDAAAELTQVVGMLQYKARLAKVALTLTCSGRRRLHGDAVKFHQLAANLAANAIEAYEGKPLQAKAHTVAITLQNGTRNAVLEVCDTGSGIESSDIATIFKPFYTTKKAAVRGTGIGLQMVERIVEQDFGGTIAVESDEHGTRFRAILRNHVERTNTGGN